MRYKSCADGESTTPHVLHNVLLKLGLAMESEA